MRTVIGVLLILLVSFAAPASAIGPFETNLLVWLHESSPTARSFGMAFSDVASIHRTPSPTGPGSLGLWALHDNVYFSHVWESQSDLYRDRVKYEISNTMYAIGAMVADLGIDSPFPAAVGILRRRGESNTTFYPGERHRWNRPRDVSDWVVALGADIGVQIGLGLRLSYRDDPPEEFERPPTARDWYAAYSIRLSLQTVMDRLNLDPRPLDFGRWEVDPIVSYASDYLSEGEQTGYAYGFTMTMDSLPVLSAEHIINPKAGNESSGWELSVLGTYAYRRGERSWPMTEFVWFEELVTVPDWSTVGHAIYTSGLQQWLHHWLGPSESSVLGWMLKNVHVRYEWAA
ncbi:MAG: hypothetical protein GF341_09645, partial [candidate division Zixibacteria bacterium]|nr:hypothetical protein [candidate division Zixibacteria bacterium]